MKGIPEFEAAVVRPAFATQWGSMDRVALVSQSKNYNGRVLNPHSFNNYKLYKISNINFKIKMYVYIIYQVSIINI